MADDNKRKKVVCAALMIAKAREDMFSELDEEAEGSKSRRRKVPRVEDYAEDVVQRMSDRDFQRSFRLTRATFNDLVTKVWPKIDNLITVSAGRQPLRADKQLLIAIQMMANQDPYRSIANLFNVSTSTAWQVTMRVCRALVALNQEDGIISWPQGQKALDMIENFERAYGFSGVIGAIDGSHIPIKAPKSQHVSYINRKGFHSILLQAVCDSNLMFTDCYAGEVGSVHDSCMLRRSDLASQMASNASAMFPGDSHIIGDPAYPLSTTLMVPYKDNGRLDARQRKFNHKLSAARSVIERAFALLKGRFRRLNRGDIPDEVDESVIDDDCSASNMEMPLISLTRARRDAVVKRDRIAQSL